MSLPPLPEPSGSGYDWMDELREWEPIGVWGALGWDLGRWPLVIICHYDRERFGLAVYVEGDIEVTEFMSRAERDKATDKLAVWYWNNYETPNAPRDLGDDRLGPYPY